MKYATVADIIAALQKMPQDAPVFGYSGIDENDNPIEVIELYTPTKEMEDEFNEQLSNGDRHPVAYPPHACPIGSFVSIYWREQKKLTPVVYIRTFTRNDKERKENIICLTVDT